MQQTPQDRADLAQVAQYFEHYWDMVETKLNELGLPNQRRYMRCLYVLAVSHNLEMIKDWPHERVVNLHLALQRLFHEEGLQLLRRRMGLRARLRRWWYHQLSKYTWRPLW